VPHDCAVQFSSAAYVADASARFAVIQVDRVHDPEGFITVQVSATNGTAKSGRDFKVVRHTFAWDDNDSSSRQLVIPLRHHARPGRTIMLKISHFNGTVPGSPTRAVLLLQG
jgi:hypothetical protein